MNITIRHLHDIHDEHDFIIIENRKTVYVILHDDGVIYRLGGKPISRPHFEAMRRWLYESGKAPRLWPILNGFVSFEQYGEYRYLKLAGIHVGPNQYASQLQIA